MSAPSRHLMAWYVPSSSGDYRLEHLGDDGVACLLTVEDPTAHEQAVLSAFMSELRQRDLVGADATFSVTGRTEIVVAAPVSRVAPLLVGHALVGAGTVTAVRSVGGKMLATIDGASPKPDPGEVAGPDVRAVELEAEIHQLEVAAKTPVDVPAAAVTVRRPVLCCPHPVEGPEMRSSQVLETFLTPSQLRDWRDHRFVTCRGNLSGRRYRVVHREHPLARRQKYIAWDIEADRPVHAYDWRVPPAEEALGLLLVLQHREDWVRNPSGWFYGGVSYPHPFGYGSSDGTLDTHLMTRAGDVVKAIGDLDAMRRQLQLGVGALMRVAAMR